jgi:hypothetical protein
MVTEKVFIICIISFLADLTGGLVFSILGIPDKIEFLINVGITMINSTSNARPSSAPQQAYIIANNGITLLQLVQSALVFLPFAILIALIISFVFFREH